MSTGTDLPQRPFDGVNAPASAPPRRVATRIGWTWIALSSLAVAAFAVIPYLTASLAQLSESGVGLSGNYADKHVVIQAAFYAHAVAGGMALITSPLQFWRGLRDRRPTLHRWIGRVALAAIGIAAVAGLVIAPFSQAGFVGFFGFGSLAVLWLVSGWKAYAAIRRRDVASHRAWMMRNFALTYAAVTLRIWLGLLITVQALGGAFEYDAAFANAYAAVPFLAWLPNLIVAEWLIRRRGLPSFRITTGTEAAAALRG
jgi:uncharacterized membrane protein